MATSDRLQTLFKAVGYKQTLHFQFLLTFPRYTNSVNTNNCWQWNPNGVLKKEPVLNSLGLDNSTEGMSTLEARDSAAL